MLLTQETQPNRDNSQSTLPKVQNPILQLWLEQTGHLPQPHIEEDAEGWDGGV